MAVVIALTLVLQHMIDNTFTTHDSRGYLLRYPMVTSYKKQPLLIRTKERTASVEYGLVHNTTGVLVRRAQREKKSLLHISAALQIKFTSTKE